MRKTKFRALSALLAVALCATVFSTTALAGGDDDYYYTVASPDSTEPLTPEGNLTLVDDIVQTETEESEPEDKQFITVQSKAGNYFYIVIDRSGDTENVYFLNLVDEADLMALIEDEETVADCVCTDKCVAGDINTSCPVCAANMSECTGKEAVTETTPEPDADADVSDEPEKKSGSPALIIVAVLLLAGGGALYYFKFRKPKTDTKGPADLDDYDYGEDEDDEEYETEDETEESDDGDTEDKSL